MDINESTIIDLVGLYFLPLVRITAFFLAAPVFGTRVVSARVRIVLGVSLSIICAPLLPQSNVISEFTVGTFIVVIQQVIIGVAMAFILQIVFQLFVLSGQYIAMKMGLGFALMNDPANGVSVTVVSQFYLLTVTLLFLSVNGHLVVIENLIYSFTILPISATGLSLNNYFQIVNLGGWMFGSALSIALPVLTSLLVVNIAFGIMSRSAPQINIFAVGFPITLIFGLFLIWVGFNTFLPIFQNYLSQGFTFSESLIETR